MSTNPEPAGPTRRGGARLRTARGSRGYKDATVDEARIRKLWRDTPDANIGIACGPSDFVVLDVDRHKNDGFASLATYEQQNGPLPKTRTSRTPNSGAHRIYVANDHVAIKNSDASKLKLPGIDIRGEDGYIVAPPSIVDGRRYEWVDECDPVAFPPPLVSEICRQPAGRNNYLAIVIAARLRNKGLSGDKLLDELLRQNAQLLEPLDEVEVRKIAASADKNYDERTGPTGPGPRVEQLSVADMLQRFVYTDGARDAELRVAARRTML
jgi:Bifunctional DNA primase/polymerase, N-terminal